MNQTNPSASIGSPIKRPKWMALRGGTCAQNVQTVPNSWNAAGYEIFRITAEIILVIFAMQSALLADDSCAGAAFADLIWEGTHQVCTIRAREAKFVTECRDKGFTQKKTIALTLDFMRKLLKGHKELTLCDTCIPGRVEQVYSQQGRRCDPDETAGVVWYMCTTNLLRCCQQRATTYSEAIDCKAAFGDPGNNLGIVAGLAMHPPGCLQSPKTNHRK